MIRHGMNGREIAALPRSMVACDQRPWKKLATTNFRQGLALTFGAQGMAGHVHHRCPWSISCSRPTSPTQPNS